MLITRIVADCRSRSSTTPTGWPVTAQSGEVLDCARAGRAHWLGLARRAGFWAAETGTVAIARHDDELAVMEQFASDRGASDT